MWKDRVKRLLMVVVVTAVVLFLAKSMFENQPGQSGGGSPVTGLVKKIESMGTKVLGKAVEKLPGAPKMEETVEIESEEAEPIEEPVKKIEKQTQDLIEAIKKLPEDQIEAIKKQITKEVCEGLNE